MNNIDTDFTDQRSGFMSFINRYQEVPFEEIQNEVEEQLQWAYAHGHLDLSELEYRLEKLQQCKSKDELLQLIEGIPAADEHKSDYRDNFRAQGPPPQEKMDLFAFLSSNDRKGSWSVPKRIQCTAILGSITLDLREALMYHREIEIEGFCFMGSIDLRLPENVAVSASGLPILGSINDKTKPVHPEYLVKFHGVTLLGSFDARTRNRRRKK